APCGLGKGCDDETDCASTTCEGGICVPPASCGDGILNGDESDVDCGGAACVGCPDGAGCGGGTDCASLSCASGICQAPSCSDGIENGAESDVDCGAACPTLCAAGKS